MLDNDTCHGACDAKDRRFDGRFYIGVTSTGIYCRCICTARTPKRENRTFWPSAAAAEAAGFRSCRICRPERAPGLAPIDAPARLAVAAHARIAAGALDEHGLERLAGEIGVTSRHLRRLLKAEFGASPIQIAQTERLLTARQLLEDTALPVIEVAHAAGFRSVRRLNATVKARYGVPPSQLRGRSSNARGGECTVRLAPRGTLHLAPVLDFLRARALPGVEVVTSQSYRRVLQFGATIGWVEVSICARSSRHTQANAGAPDLLLTFSENLTPWLRRLIVQARGAFDLDADLHVIDTHLALDDNLAQDVAHEPFVRVPGTFDGFETAVRAVLGQQVTVAGARTLAQRLVARFGTTDLQLAREGLCVAFPDAARLAEAGPAAIAAIGLPRQRAATVHRLAVAACAGELPLQRGAIAAGRAALAAMPGIGPWTVEYLAMRALGDPDAYPTTDAALVAALGRNGERLDHLRPWRAYAAVRLWRRAARAAPRVRNAGTRT